MCPWGSWTPTTLYFCEAAACAWVKQPGNSFSNVFYLLVAFIVWRKWRRSHRRMVRQLALALGVVTVGSFLLHASLTFFGEVADLTGMFFLSACLVQWNLERYVQRRFQYREAMYLAFSLVPTALMLKFGSVGILLFKVSISVALLLELKMWWRGDSVSYRSLLIVGAIFLVAYGVWWLDVHESWCNAQSYWFSGHIIWHLLTAVAVIPLANFYSQFKTSLFPG